MKKVLIEKLYHTLHHIYMNRKATAHKKLQYLIITGLCVVISFFTINIGHSQNNANLPDYFPSVRVTIRYFNKQIYYMGQPIIVEIEVANQSYEPFLFITSYKKEFTFDFEITSTTNRKIPHSKNYIINRHQFETVLNDEITLKKDEIYGVRINISEWFDFENPGEYIIKGVFYPSLAVNPEIKIYSFNQLHLTLRPPYREEIRKKEREQEIERLKAESLPPYETVRVMLNALMNRDFEKYFLYIKFDKFIMQFSNARKKYLAAKDVNKPDVIEKFKEYLKGENEMESIPYSETIPADFEIEKTIIEKRDARILVTEEFKYKNLIEKKQYTYYLHKYGDKWLLESYTVVNIGG